MVEHLCQIGFSSEILKHTIRNDTTVYFQVSGLEGFGKTNLTKKPALPQNKCYVQTQGRCQTSQK